MDRTTALLAQVQNGTSLNTCIVNTCAVLGEPTRIPHNIDRAALLDLIANFANVTSTAKGSKRWGYVGEQLSLVAERTKQGVDDGSVDDSAKARYAIVQFELFGAEIQRRPSATLCKANFYKIIDLAQKSLPLVGNISYLWRGLSLLVALMDEVESDEIRTALIKLLEAA